MGKQWILIDIGCLHCDEPSEVVGVYDDKEEANLIAKTWQGICDANVSGQHDFIIRELPEINTTNKKYR